METSLHSAIPRLAIVVPCFNEAEVFGQCCQYLCVLLAQMTEERLIAYESYLLFVDDGSRDNTWQQIEQATSTHKNVKGVKLSRNVGHQSALRAGLECASKGADAIVSIDADLQDDTTIISEMVMAYRHGYDVVYGVRSSRQTDSWFKRTTAQGFYRLMFLMGVKQVFNHADFRLLSKRALQALLEYKECNAYLRGLVPLVGFPSTKVYYARGLRQAGESKYSLRKMLALAVEGITSMTISPLRIIAFSGFSLSIFSVLAVIYIFAMKVTGHTVVGWSSLMFVIFFMGGIQMLALGVIGEYIGKIYLEVKRRPIFHIDKEIK